LRLYPISKRSPVDLIPFLINVQFIPLSWLIIFNPDKAVLFHIKSADKTNWNLVIYFLLV
jgi:hypothetical protein